MLAHCDLVGVAIIEIYSCGSWLIFDLRGGAQQLAAEMSSRTPWNFTRTQQSGARLQVVVKDGKEIGATILYSRRTPAKIRRQTKKRPYSGPPTTSTLETGMLRLDLMHLNSGKEQWDNMEWEKPMKEEKDF